MEARLIGCVAMLWAYRAGAAGKAAALAALGAFGTVEMGNAGRNIVTARRKRIDRTPAEARFVGAACARTCADVRLGQIEPFAKCERAAPRMPQAPVGMN